MSVKFPEIDEAGARTYEQWYYTRKGKKIAEAEITALREAITQLCGENRELTILEVGCGTGYFARALSENRHSIVGVDYSHSMVKVAQEKQNPNIIFVEADAHLLPFRDNSFDISLFITSLEFITKPELAIKEARRVSRRGIILLVLNPYHWMNLRRWLNSKFKPSVFHNAHFYSPLKIKKRLVLWLHPEGILSSSISLQFSLDREFYLVVVSL